LRNCQLDTAMAYPTSFSPPNGGDWAKIAVNWLDWQLKGNAEAGKWFVGDDCGYCTDANWKVEYKPEG
jgi:hypothetical protein